MTLRHEKWPKTNHHLAFSLTAKVFIGMLGRTGRLEKLTCNSWSVLDNPPDFWRHYTWDKKQQLPSVQPKGRAKEMRGRGILWMNGSKDAHTGTEEALKASHTQNWRLSNQSFHTRLWSWLQLRRSWELQISFFTGSLTLPAANITISV